MRMSWVLVVLAVGVVGVVLAGMFRGQARAEDHITPLPATIPANLRQATFAGGCFWGVEEAFRQVKGVVSTRAGYTGGHLANPTYRDVCTHLTGHAEAVLVTYDPAVVSYEQLLDAFWTCHDPTQKDRQGPDVGDNYRSAIFFHDAAQEKAARASMKEIEDRKLFDGPIVTQIVPAVVFYPAEDYHQQYMAKIGGTCHKGPVVVQTELAKKAAPAAGK